MQLQQDQVLFVTLHFIYLSDCFLVAILCPVLIFTTQLGRLQQEDGERLEQKAEASKKGNRSGRKRAGNRRVRYKGNRNDDKVDKSENFAKR